MSGAAVSLQGVRWPVRDRPGAFGLPRTAAGRHSAAAAAAGGGKAAGEAGPRRAPAPSAGHRQSDVCGPVAAADQQLRPGAAVREPAAGSATVAAGGAPLCQPTASGRTQGRPHHLRKSARVTEMVGPPFVCASAAFTDRRQCAV